MTTEIIKKKILIKLSDDPEKIVQSFPFLMEVQNFYKNDEINLVIEEENASVVKFIPNKIKIYEIPQEKRSLLGIHHFVCNLNDVFNVDIFFDLDGSFKTAFLGSNFRSKERFGFDEGIKKFFYNKKIKTDEKRQYWEKTLDLLSAATNIDYSGKEYNPSAYIEIVEKMAKLSQEYVPSFILAVIDVSKKDGIELFWDSFFANLPRIHFKVIFWGQDEEKLALEKTFLDRIKQWKIKCTIERIHNKDFSKLIKALIQCKGLASDIFWINRISSFYGVSSFYFYNGTKEEIKIDPDLENTVFPLKTEENLTSKEHIEFLLQTFKLSTE